MKFKALVVVINIVLISTFLCLFFLPFLIVSPKDMPELRQKGVLFTGLFGIALLLLNGVLLGNWAVMDFLEKEDWPGLAHHLEVRVLGQKRYRKRSARLLLESLVVLGDFETIGKFASRLKDDRPRLYRELAPCLSGAFILAGKYGLASDTVEFAMGNGRALGSGDLAWLKFYRGLSAYMERSYGKALEDFMPLCVESDDPLVTALSGYLCSVSAGKHGGTDGTPGRAADDARSRVREKIPRKAWDRYVDRAKEDIRIVILGSLINQAGAWIYG